MVSNNIKLEDQTTGSTTEKPSLQPRPELLYEESTLPLFTYFTRVVPGTEQYALLLFRTNSNATAEFDRRQSAVGTPTAQARGISKTAATIVVVVARAEDKEKKRHHT